LSNEFKTTWENLRIFLEDVQRNFFWKATGVFEVLCITSDTVTIKKLRFEETCRRFPGAEVHELESTANFQGVFEHLSTAVELAATENDITMLDGIREQFDSIKLDGILEYCEFDDDFVNLDICFIKDNCAALIMIYIQFD